MKAFIKQSTLYLNEVVSNMSYHSASNVHITSIITYSEVSYFVYSTYFVHQITKRPIVPFSTTSVSQITINTATNV